MDVYRARHLIALAERGTFSGAAESVNLTQSALSRSIQGLERELGITLADRRGRRVVLTEAGRLAVARARRLVAEESDARRALDLLAKGETGTLRIGAAPLPGARILRVFLAQMARTRPQVRVQVSLAATRELVDRLRGELVDAILGDDRSIPPDDDLVIERLGSWRMGFAVRTGHPALALPRLTLPELGRWPVASLALSAEGSRAAQDGAMSANHPMRFVTIWCQDVAMLRDLALDTDTILAVAPDSIAAELRTGTLLSLPVEGVEALSGTIAVARLAWRTPSPSLGVLYDLARSLASAPAGG